MKIAILSDIHDNVWNLGIALRRMPATDAMIFCGDLCSPFVVGLLGNGYSKPIHVVFGNNDGDLYRITRVAGAFEHVHLHGEYYEESFDGRSLAVTHYPEIASAIGSSKSLETVCYGHNHRYAIQRDDQTLLLNPGPVMGYDPIAASDVPATFLIYDTASHVATGYRIEGEGVVAIWG